MRTSTVESLHPKSTSDAVKTEYLLKPTRISYGEHAAAVSLHLYRLGLITYEEV